MKRAGAFTLWLGVVVAVIAGVRLWGMDPVDYQQQRLAVQWRSIEVSEDRRTVTVTAAYPVGGPCVREPDGVDVRLQGTTAIVAVWMKRGGAHCAAACELVTQAVILDTALPKGGLTFVPVEGAVRGCR